MNQASLLITAVEAKKEELINQLIDCGIYKSADGRDLWQLSLPELQDMFRGC